MNSSIPPYHQILWPSYPVIRKKLKLCRFFSYLPIEFQILGVKSLPPPALQYQVFGMQINWSISIGCFDWFPWIRRCPENGAAWIASFNDVIMGWGLNLVQLMDCIGHWSALIHPVARTTEEEESERIAERILEESSENPWWFPVNSSKHPPRIFKNHRESFRIPENLQESPRILQESSGITENLQESPKILENLQESSKNLQESPRIF